MDFGNIKWANRDSSPALQLFNSIRKLGYDSTLSLKAKIAQKHSSFKIFENKHNKMVKRIKPQDMDRIQQSKGRKDHEHKASVEIKLPFIFPIDS